MPFNGLPPLSSAHSCRLPGTTTSGQVREPAFHCYSPGVSDYLPKMRNCSRLIQKGVHSGQFALVWSRCFLLVKGEKMCRKVCTSDSLEFLLLWVWWKGGGGFFPKQPHPPTEALLLRAGEQAESSSLPPSLVRGCIIRQPRLHCRRWSISGAFVKVPGEISQ